MSDGSERPLLRVVRGEPTTEELAALVAVVAMRAAAAEAEASPPPAPSPWSARAAGLRQAPHPGPGAWRATGGIPGTRTRAAL
jgi:hypothetical protein